MPNSAILSLMISSEKINKTYKSECAEELYSIYEKNNNSISLKGCQDTIREIFVVIKLPKLNGGKYWIDNILLKLINNIKIILNGYFLTTEIVISKDYINKLINEILINYPNELLFRNISIDKRQKLSRDEIELILPLKISNFIDNPNEIIMVHMFKCEIMIDFDYNELIENEDLVLDNID